MEMILNQGTRESIKEYMPGVLEIDRTTMNAWEDVNFRKAIELSRKKKIVFAAL